MRFSVRRFLSFRSRAANRNPDFLPDFRPGPAEVATKKNIGVVGGFFVGHAFAIGDVADQFHGIEAPLQDLRAELPSTISSSGGGSP